MPNESAFTNENLTEMFENSLEKFPVFPEAAEIARRDALGNLWIIGGFVYRNLVREIYGRDSFGDSLDIDFLIENHPGRELYLPEGWTHFITRYGNVGLSKDNVRTDLNYLYEFPSLRCLKSPGIDDFVRRNTLNIQCIVYSMNDNLVFGQTGIQSLKEKMICVNDLGEITKQAEVEGTTIKHLVKRKAHELGFDYKL